MADDRGVKFIEEDPSTALGTLGSHGGVFKLVDYARSVVETMMEAHDRFYLEETDFERTIAIDALGVGTTEFDLSRERAMKLYESGRAGAEEFLSYATSSRTLEVSLSFHRCSREGTLRFREDLF